MITLFTRHRPWLSLSLAALAFGSMMASAAPIAQTYFVPLPETDFQSSLKAIDTTGTAVGNSLRTIISVVVPTAGSIIVYDQWEDGYEADPNAPIQSTTQVWGDGNTGNGTAPGYPTDVFPAGAVVTLSNLITLPRNPSTLAYDGRDRISTTKAIAVTRAGWAVTPGTVLASATEVYDTRKWGTAFKMPVGVSTSATQVFEYSSLHIIAAQNGTVVNVDKDHNGSIDVTQTLNLGQSMFVNGGIQPGAIVTSNLPIEIHEMTGDIGSTYESRTFAIRPTAQWSDVYYAPASTTLASETHNIFLFNPGVSTITVTASTTTGNSSLSVPAGGNYQFTMPMNSGAKFASVGAAPFYAVGTNDSGAASGSNQTHDWGYALLPSTALTTEVVIGFGPGSDDTSAPTGPDQNGSPVWVTPSAATTIYVNYTGDYSVGALIAPDDRHYDVAYSVGLLAAQRIFDTTDKDMTKARLFTADGTTFAAAWGEDSATAGPGAPYLDMGTTVIPFPIPVFRKTAALVNDLNSDGYVGVGDTVEFTLSLNNDGVTDLPDAVISDTIPAGTSYVPSSTTLDAVAYPDDGSGTAFPLDGAGITIGSVPLGNSVQVKFRVIMSVGTTSVTNTATASSPGLETPLTSTITFSVLPGAVPPPGTVAFTDSIGTDVTIYAPNAGIYLTVTDAPANTNSGTVQTLTVVVTDPTTGDQEIVTLTETGANTGIFRNTSALPSSTTTGTGQQDGTLYAQSGHTLNVSYIDTTGGTRTDTAIISTPTQTKKLYLTDTLALDRVDPVATSDATTASSAVLSAGSSTVSVAATTSSSTTSGTTLTFSHTPGNGNNRLLLVAVGTGGTTNSGSGGNVTGVTYNGVAMSLVGSKSPPTLTGTRSFIYSLLNPSAGPANVVVSVSAASSIGAGATTFNDVDQTTPLSSYASDSADSVGSSRVDLQACKLEYSIVSPK